MGQAGRGRAQGGERLMGTAACGRERFTGRAVLNGERPIGATSRRRQYNQVPGHPPPPQTPRFLPPSPLLMVLRHMPKPHSRPAPAEGPFPLPLSELHPNVFPARWWTHHMFLRGS